MALIVIDMWKRFYKVIPWSEIRNFFIAESTRQMVVNVST